MADPVIRAAFRLPAAAAASTVDRLGRCRDSITLGVTFFFSSASHGDAFESGGCVQDVPKVRFFSFERFFENRVDISFWILELEIVFFYYYISIS